MKTKKEVGKVKEEVEEEIVQGTITCSACGNIARVYPQLGLAICPLCGSFPYVFPPKSGK